MSYRRAGAAQGAMRGLTALMALLQQKEDRGIEQSRFASEQKAMADFRSQQLASQLERDRLGVDADMAGKGFRKLGLGSMTEVGEPTTEVGGSMYAAPPPKPVDPVNWQTQQTANGIVQVHPETGEVRPLTMGGRSLRPPPQQQAAPSMIPIQTPGGTFWGNPKTGDLRPMTDPGNGQQVTTGSAGRLSPQRQQAIQSNEGQLRVINDALAQLGANPKAIGAKGYIPDALLNRMNPSGVPARASIADIGSLNIHERAGSAASAGEMERVKPFIPSDTDTPEVATAKLQRLRRFIQDENDAMRGTTASQAPSAPPPSGRTPLGEASLSDADLWEKKVRDGMPKDSATAYVQRRRK